MLFSISNIKKLAALQYRMSNSKERRLQGRGIAFTVSFAHDRSRFIQVYCNSNEQRQKFEGKRNITSTWGCVWLLRWQSSKRARPRSRVSFLHTMQIYGTSFQKETTLRNLIFLKNPLSSVGFEARNLEFDDNCGKHLGQWGGKEEKEGRKRRTTTTTTMKTADYARDTLCLSANGLYRVIIK